MFRGVFLAFICLAVPLCAWADDTAATQPTTQPVQTGEVDLTFTERSPLSKPEEIARRLSLKADDVKDDYDLSQRPFKAYVPTNYDPAVPHGLFVYLGYKDTVATPPPWHALLEKNHLIFISPVAHTGSHYQPEIPIWESIGLAFDAVYNCKKQFNIDDHRIYLMSWNDNSMRASFSTADIFTGLIVTADSEYCYRISLPNRTFYKPDFVPPSPALMGYAKSRAFFLIDVGAATDKTKLVMSAMQHDGFKHVMMTQLSLESDLHYPNLSADWLDQQALPFLDKASTTARIAKAATEPTTKSSEEPVSNVSAAQHILDIAQLCIKSGQTDLARKKLQQIIDNYPTDPAAEKAKELLAQLNQ